MRTDRNFHLENGWLLRAVVDESDLSSASREHLLTCTHCREKTTDIEKNLLKLGQMAEHFAPSSNKPIILPAIPRQLFIAPWHFRRAWGVAVACLSVLVLGTWIFLKDMPAKKTTQMTRHISNSEQLMSEVDALSENALPSEYMAMLGDSDDEEDGDYLDFMIPSTENDTTSFNLNQTGGKPC